MQIVKYQFQQHGDERGQLVALEEFNDIPFEIKRVYYMYDTGKGVVRGHHAHKTLEQILICIHGSCKILLDWLEESSFSRQEVENLSLFEYILEKKRKRFFLKNHMKVFTFLIICGEKCMIFPKMQY